MDNDDASGTGFPVGRRTALGLGVGTLAMLAAGPARGTPLDPANVADARRIQRRMQHRTDDGLVFWWLRGPHFAQVGADLTPLYEMNHGTVQRVTQRSDGGFDVMQLEAAFRTDLDTGKRLTEIRKPGSNEIVPIIFTPVGPSAVRYSPDNVPTVPAELGGSKIAFEAIHSLPFRIGDEVYYRHRARTVVSTPGASDRLINDIATFSAPARQVLDPKVAWVDTRLQSSDVTGWPRWLKMGTAPGGMTLRAVGAKVRSFNEMPTAWLEMLHDTRPDIANDPIGALDRAQAKYTN